MITREEWLSPDADPLLAFYADGGPLARACGSHYAYSELQHRYAESVRRRIVGDGGMVRFVEAESGVGKSMGYLGPALIHSALTGRRVLISTFTNFLKRQIATGDGPQTADAVAAFTGMRRPTLAMRHSYREFASPIRARNLAAAIRADGKGDGKAADALLALANWTVGELEFASRHDWRTVVDQGRGLVGTWEEANPTLAVELPRDDSDLWCVDLTQDDDLALKRLYDDAVDGADVVLCSHATTILDMKLGGRLLGGFADPFAVAVIDEADRMEDAARLVLSTKLAMRSLERTLLVVAKAMEDNRARLKPASIRRLEETMSHHGITFGRLTALANRLTEDNRRRTSASPRIGVTGDETWTDDKGVRETWISTIGRAADAADELGDILYDSEVPELMPLAEILASRADDAEIFLEAIEEPRRAHGRPFVSFSPVRAEPSLVVDAKFAGRLLHRLWDGVRKNGDRPLADSVIVTSATLTQPGARGPQRWRRLGDEIGLGVSDYARFDAAGSASFAPDVHAELSFVLAHPLAPVPTTTDEIDDSLRYQAEMIAAAALRPSAEGRCNVLALTTSFRDAELLGGLLERNYGLVDALKEGSGGRLIARPRNMSLRKAVHLFRTTPNVVLVTPGAWEGVDMPGLIDHEVICRLPFAPPEDEFGIAISDYREDTGHWVSDNVGRMMGKLKQAFGRVTRRRTDKATVWIADPRFPLPPQTEAALGMRSLHVRNRVLHECVPVRFRRALGACEVAAIELPQPRAGRKTGKRA